MHDDTDGAGLPLFAAKCLEKSEVTIWESKNIGHKAARHYFLLSFFFFTTSAASNHSVDLEVGKLGPECCLVKYSCFGLKISHCSHTGGHRHMTDDALIQTYNP